MALESLTLLCTTLVFLDLIYHTFRFEHLHCFCALPPANDKIYNQDANQDGLYVAQHAVHQIPMPLVTTTLTHLRESWFQSMHTRQKPRVPTQHACGVRGFPQRFANPRQGSQKTAILRIQCSLSAFSLNHRCQKKCTYQILLQVYKIPLPSS